MEKMIREQLLGLGDQRKCKASNPKYEAKKMIL